MGQIFSWLMAAWILYSASRLYDEWCSKSAAYVICFWTGYSLVLLIPLLFFNLAPYLGLPYWTMFVVGYLFFVGVIPLLKSMKISSDMRARYGLPRMGIAPDHPFLYGFGLLGLVTAAGWWLWF